MKKAPLAATNPELAREAVGWNPQEIMPVATKVTWICSKDHLYESVISERKRGKGCPYCAGKKVLVGFNDLLTTHPEKAAEAYEWDPTEYSAGSNEEKKWKCTLGHITVSSLKNHALEGNACRVCTNQEVLSGFNDLATLHPDISGEAVNWDPALVIPGSNKKYKWRCPLGHVYEQSPGSRIIGRACKICAKKEILIGFNDLHTLYPEVSEEAHGWDPKTIFPGTKARKEFKCKEGHIYLASVKDRTSSGSGCPTCSKSGFNPGLEGFLYLMKHQHWGKLQIGITNYPDQRLRVHASRGWQLLEIRGPIDGLLARSLETDLLMALKKMDVDLGSVAISGKFDGYSEAWNSEKLDVLTLKDLFELASRYESREIHD